VYQALIGCSGARRRKGRSMKERDAVLRLTEVDVDSVQQHKSDDNYVLAMRDESTRTW